ETGADTPRCTHGSAARDRAAGPARPPPGRTTAPPTPKTSFPAGLPRSSPPLRYLPDIAGSRVVHSLAKHRSIPLDVLSVPAGTNAIISDRKSTRLNSSHVKISYAVFCLKKKK